MGINLRGLALIKSRYEKTIFKILVLCFVCFITACTQPYRTQSAKDEASLRPNTEEFAQAKSIIKSNCLSCHSSSGSASFASFNFENEDEFIQNGWITPGDPENSKLIYRTKGYTSSLESSLSNRGMANMPPSGSFGLEDFIILRNWVIATGSKKDQDPPEVKILSPVANFKTESSLMLSGSCEVDSGVVKVTGDILSAPLRLQCSNTGLFTTEVVLLGEFGTKSIRVEQADLAGNVGFDTRAFLKMDLTAPDLSIVSPLAGFRSTETIDLLGSCEVGASLVSLSGDIQAIDSQPCSSDGSFSAKLTFSMGVGLKIVQASQQDSSGNIAQVSRSFERIAVVENDTTPPVVTIEHPAVGSKSEKNLSIQGTCEAGAGAILIGGDAVQVNTVCTNAGTYEALIELSGDLGNKTIQISQQDMAGNLGSVERIFEKVDLTPPLVTVDSPPSGDKHPMGLTVKGRCENGASDLIFSGDIQNLSPLACSSEGTYQVNIQFSGDIGLKSFEVKQQDASGNVGSDQRTFTKVAPPTKFELAKGVLEARCVSCHGLGGSQASKPLNLLTEQDYISAGWIVSSDIHSSKLIYRTQGYTGGSFNANMPTNETLPISEYQILVAWVEGMDDTSPPELLITSPQAGTQVEAGAMLSGVCEPGASTVEVTGDILAVSPLVCSSEGVFSAMISFKPGLGTKSITVAQSDEASNRATDTRSFERVDNAPPIIEITEPVQGTQSSDGLTIKGICEVGSSVISITGEVQESGETVACDSSGKFQTFVTFSGDLGVKTVSVSQQDSSKNLGSDSRQFEKIAPPTRFELAKVVLQNNCVSCHGPGGEQASQPLNLASEQQFVDAGWISPRRLEVSKLIYRTQGYPEGGSNANMPTNKLLAITDYQLLADWVENMQDTVAPTVSITSPQSGTPNEDGVHITGTCEPGASAVSISGDIQAHSPVSCSGAGDFSATLIFSAGLGVKTIYVSQQDSSENVGNDSRSFERVDVAPPVVQIQLPAAGVKDPLGLTILGICEVGASAIVLSGDINEAGNEVACGSDGTFSVGVTFTGETGLKTVQVSQADASGNTGSDSRDFEKTSPPTSFELAKSVLQNRCVSCHGPGGSRSSKPLNLNTEQEFIDAGWVVPQNIHQSKVLYRTQGYPGGGNANMPTNATLPLSEYKILEDWVNSMNDTIAPDLSFVSPQQGAESETELAIAGTCEVGAGQVSLSGDILSHPAINCSSLGLFSATVQWTSGLGEKTVTVSQTDSSGNTGVASRNFMRVDNAAPIVEILLPVVGTQDEVGLTISGVCEKGSSLITLSGDILESGSVTSCSSSGEFMMSVNFSSGAGNKVVTVSQQDGSGNVGTHSRTFERIEESAPPVDPTQRFANAQNILSEFCISCHKAGGSASSWPLDYASEAEFVTAGFVEPGDIDNSKLIYRLIHYSGSKVALRNMPAGSLQDTFSTADYNVLKDWVLQMDPNVGHDPAGGSDGTNPFICTDPSVTSKTLTYLLTKRQYEKSMRLLFGDTFIDQLNSYMDLIPEETYSKYERGRLSTISPSSFEVYQDVAIAIADAVKSDPVKRSEVFGNCGSSAGAPPSGLTTIFNQSSFTNGSVFPHQSAYELGQGTIEMIITPTSGDLSSKKGLFSKDHTGYGSGGHLSIYLESGVLKSRLQSESADYPTSMSGIVANQKHHVVMSFGPGQHKMYLNGVLKSTAVYTGGLIGQSQDVVLGALNWGSQPGGLKIESIFSGAMDFVKIYGSQLSDSQVTQLANSHDLNSSPYCLDSYLNGLAKMIYRRPLTVEEKAYAQSLVDQGVDLVDGLSMVLAYHLQSPHFIMRMELGTIEDIATEYELSPYEVATRLAYAATDAGPDQALLNLAANGQIMNLATMKNEVRRLLKTKRGIEKVRHILLTWSHNDSVSSLAPLPVEMRSEYGDLGLLEGAMIEEAGKFVEYVVFNEHGNFVDLLTSKASFASNPDLAKIYGHTAIGEEATIPTSVSGRRHGLLMRAPALAYSSPRTSIIERGVAFQADVLCNELPTPPDDIVDQRDDVSFTEAELLNMTNRQKIAEITGADACMVCHSKINPTGFAFEGIGPFGELRTEEKIFNQDDVFHRTLSIDTMSAVPLDNTQSLAVADAYDLVQYIGESPIGKACFSRKVFRILNEKREVEADSCQLKPMYDEINNSNGSLLEAFVNLIANESAKRKQK